MKTKPEPPRGISSGLQWAIAVLVGIALASFAVLVDEVQLPGGRLLIVVFSTGLSWGVAAAAMGAIARDRISAGVTGLLVLLTAVIGYYLINHLLGFRGAGSSMLQAGFTWGMAALVGGPFLGLLGWHTRFGEDRQRSLAYGVLAGLLLGQGLRWSLRYGLSPDPVFTTALLVPLAIFFVGGRGRAVGPGLVPLLVTAPVSAGVWAVLETIT